LISFLLGFVNGRKRYLTDKKVPPSIRHKLELKSELEVKFKGEVEMKPNPANENVNQ
jgi:hypothetical protein